MTTTKTRIRTWLHAGLSLVLGGGLLYGLTNPVGPAPALAKVVHPANGIWATVADGELTPQNQQLTLPALQDRVQILFEADGTPHIKAATNHDAWLAIGYLHAENRLFQMDLMRRQGAGRLSEIMGEAALEADKFQVQVGMERTAAAEWAEIEPGSPLHETLTAYTAGVNAVIEKRIAEQKLPMMFQALGYEPAPWKPEDTLLLKGVLTQMMSLQPNAIYRQLFAESLGYDRMMELFPILPPNEQRPYDEGPYPKSPLAPMPISAEQALREKAGVVSVGTVTPAVSGPGSVDDLLRRLEELPTYALHRDGNSNAWVIDGTKTASGKPLLAGDPHMGLSLPSVWYQVQVEAPDYRFKGVGVPGIPMILIGQNDHIAWSITNGQTQQTFFYEEKTDESRPGQYFWKGEWRDFTAATYEIPVKGGQSVPFEVRSSVHGPLVTHEGKTLAMTWIGAIPSRSLEGLLALNRAADYGEFEQALSNWTTPTLNFAYADDQGSIAVIGAGYYPVFAEDAKPWMPQPGTGEYDILGTVPYADIPKTVNPPNHIIGTANQRPVGTDFPYYIGSTNEFDYGYRATRIYDLLEKESGLTAEDFQQMQGDVYDPLAAKIVPALLDALADAELSAIERALADKLAQWDLRMTEDSAAAAVWGTFWDQYIHTVLDPWWEHHNVPVEKHKILAVNSRLFNQVMESWTLTDPDNPYFDNPVTKEQRTAQTAMQQAFRTAAAHLQEQLGDDVNTWKWGTLHKRVIPALTQLEPLGHAPQGAGGNLYTLNVAPDLASTHGPAWRMIADLGTGETVGIYPGGQSENPVSPLYRERIADWWNLDYRPLLNYEQAAKQPGNVTWNLLPGDNN